MVAHQWADADHIDVPANQLDTEWWGTQAATDDTWEDPVTDPPPDLDGYRTGFWLITPPGDREIRLYTYSFSQDGFTGLWRRVGNVWSTIAASTQGPVTANVIGGQTYIIGAGFADPDEEGMFFTDAQLQPTTAEQIQVPAINLSAGISARIGGEIDVIEAPTLSLGTRIPIIPLNAFLPAPVSVTAAGPLLTGTTTTWTGSLVLSAPEDGAVVATTRPNFMVGVDFPVDDPDTTYTLDVQYADTEDFASPTTISEDFDGVDGGVIVTPVTPLTAATIFWRARLSLAGTQLTDWTDSQQFSVDTDPGDQRINITWTVDTSANRPVHLWHFDPPGPEVGEQVTIYGHGFPPTGTVRFGDDPLTVDSWQLVPATADNTDPAARLIDGSTVTCEHYEVVFEAPASDSSGDVLTVEG